MKPIFKFTFLLFSFISLLACKSTPLDKQENNAKTTQDKKEEKYGAEISPENAIAVSQIPALLAQQDSLELKVIGKIGECCQTKGCWMKVPIDENQEMLVRFKDYGFFVPMDSEGKEIVMEGKVKKEIITVAQLRHYAEDAGKSEEEIEKITKDEIKITFLATGVIIRD